MPDPSTPSAGAGPDQLDQGDATNQPPAPPETAPVEAPAPPAGGVVNPTGTGDVGADRDGGSDRDGAAERGSDLAERDGGADDGDEGGSGGSGGSGGPPEPARRDRKKVELDVRFLLAIILVAALAAGAYAFGSYQANKGTSNTPKPTSTTVFQTPKDFRTLQDPDTGVEIAVPADWTQYSTKDLADKAIRFTVGIPNTGDTVVVRVNAYSAEITDANIGDQKAVFDQLLGAEKIQIYVNEKVTLGGLPALFYVYRFVDDATSKAGIHAHYFVFQGRKMVSLIFQALPDTRYEVLAPTFDKIANSLKVAPGPPPAFLDPALNTQTTAPTTATTVAPAQPPAPPTTG